LGAALGAVHYQAPSVVESEASWLFDAQPLPFENDLLMLDYSAAVSDSDLALSDLPLNLPLLFA